MLTFYKIALLSLNYFSSFPNWNIFLSSFLDFNQPLPDHIRESQQSYALPLDSRPPFFIQDLMLTIPLTAQSVPFQLTNMNNLFSIIFKVLQDYRLKV